MLILMTASEIIPYQRQYLEPLNSQYLTIPKFAPKDAPNWAPGYGKSYIDLSRMTFNNDCDGSYLFSDGECRNSTFEILMFEEPRDKYWMDYWPGKQLCCTAEMASVGE